MKATTIFLILACLVGAGIALVSQAAGPYQHFLESGTGSDYVVVSDSLATNYVLEPVLYFPDADVTVSFWDYSTRGKREWFRVNTGDALSDSVTTCFAGTTVRPDFQFKAIYVTRTDATSGAIFWFR